MNDDLGEIICTRKLKSQDETARRSVVVRLGRPIQKGRSWLCPFKISGIGPSKVVFASGEDSFQALMMALEGVRATLARGQQALTWKGGEEGDHGFAKLLIGGERLDLRKRLENLAEKEEEEYWRRAARGSKGRGDAKRA